MRKSRFDSGPQGVFRHHVRDRVVDQDGIEGAVEPECSHVAGDVLAARIDLAAELEHLFGEITQGALESLFQVQRVVARARAEFEERTAGAGDSALEGGLEQLRFVFVVLRRVEQPIPGREGVIDLHRHLHQPGLPSGFFAAGMGLRSVYCNATGMRLMPLMKFERRRSTGPLR